MANQNLTELVFILDKSGSMHDLKEDTVGGYNSVLAENRAMNGDAVVSTVLFDNNIDVIHDRVPISEVRDMGLQDYRPAGCTALLDAVGGAIKYHSAIQRALPGDYRAGHVLFVIVTDGYENASKRYTYLQIKSLIENRRRQGWEFVFLASGINVPREADRLGISVECAMPYEPSPVGTASMYAKVAEVSRTVRSGIRARLR